MAEIQNELEPLLRPQASAVQQKADLANYVAKLSPEARLRVTKWVFEEHKGYTDVRAWAGREFVMKQPAEGWTVLKRLVDSDNPDDREAALTVLADIPESLAYELSRPLLKDPWPYIRFDAIDFLKDVYPIEVASALRELQHHEQKWVQEEALKRLKLMRVE